jgi:2-dehydro-3-deoxyphosphooctonate aldolase (KDO 8-P synthase)
MLKALPTLKNTEANNFYLLAGPCAIESEEMAFEIAEKIKEVTDKLQIPFIFKGSYRKANRSRLDSFTGIGDLKAEYVDVLQIPAFLCRQTDLLVAAAKTGKAINIKKGQFLSAESMQFAAQKVIDSGNSNVAITDRGTMFGYQDLIVDMRVIPAVQNLGFPVVLDITHSLQTPNQTSGITGGKPQLIETIAKAGIAAGADGIFLETHPNPSEAKSDGANMLPLDQLEDLLTKLVRVRKAII